MKKAVVSFVTSVKDFLYPPVFDFSGVDFLCFTDLNNVKSQFWKICPLNGLFIEEIKENPKKYLPDYDGVIFAEAGSVVTKDADGNIKIVEKPDISECVDLGYFKEVQRVVNEAHVSESASEANLKLYTGEKQVYPLKLTIGMLVGRKSPYFDKCFESIGRIMKAIPESELIIVDTGNEDGSVDKLRKSAAEGQNITIVPFTWIHNFAAARNEAVKRASGAWYMTLDDDEWFEDISAIVDFFESDKELYKKYDYAMYTQRNYEDKESNSYRDVGVARLAKNRSDLCYIRRIHETFNSKEKESKTYIIDSYVHHYGYVNNMESRKLKSQRNMALLALDNEENPTDSHVIVQIIQEMLFTERPEIAYIYLMRGLSAQRIKPDLHIATFVSVLGYILSKTSKNEHWNYESRYVRSTRLNYVEQACVVYYYAIAAYQQAFVVGCADDKNGLNVGARKYIDKAIEYSVCFEKTYADYNNASVDTKLAVSGTICDNFCVDERYLADMRIIRALAYEQTGADKEVIAILKSINPDKLKICLLNYYEMLVRYNIATVEFYSDNKNVQTIWMLFVQALLQKPVLCAELLKCIETSELDRLITVAKPYVNPEEKASYDQAFEELVVLRLVCEYMQNGEYNMAINALKIALQGSEQTKAVALILFEELKDLTS